MVEADDHASRSAILFRRLLEMLKLAASSLKEPLNPPENWLLKGFVPENEEEVEENEEDVARNAFLGVIVEGMAALFPLVPEELLAENSNEFASLLPFLSFLTLLRIFGNLEALALNVEDPQIIEAACVGLTSLIQLLRLRGSKVRLIFPCSKIIVGHRTPMLSFSQLHIIFLIITRTQKMFPSSVNVW